jgi:predicted small secreted protein
MHTTNCPHTVDTQYLQTAHNVIIKNKVKITNNAKNNYYNIQLSYIHLAQSLGHVGRHTVEGTRNNEM